MIEIRWFFICEVLYIKELDNIDEIFKKDSKIPFLLKYVIYFLKKLFCILTIKDNKICILPYKKIHNRIIIKIITKIVLKTTKNVVLSNYLNELEELNRQFYKSQIHIYKGNELSYYLIYNFIDYICKVKNEEIISQEVYILVNDLNEMIQNIIIDISKKIKRINIVTPRIKDFIRISDYLEELGIAITVTNNRRKSLLKAKFIVNFDFNEDTLNLYKINTEAIIIEMNKDVKIKSKLFNGINILDFQITYNSNFPSTDYNKFDKKILYEQSLTGKSYETIIKKIEEDNVKIVNLIGKNGVISTKEYVKI